MSEGVGSGGKLFGGFPAGHSTTIERFGIRAVAGGFRSRRTLFKGIDCELGYELVSAEERGFVSAEVGY